MASNLKLVQRGGDAPMVARGVIRALIVRISGNTCAFPVR